MELIDEIIKASIGKDSNDKPKAAITISNDAYGIFNESVKRISSHSSYKAELNIEKIKNYITV